MDNFLQALEEAGIIDETRLKELPAEVLQNPKTLEEEVLRRRWAEEETLLEVKSRLLSIPILRITGREIPANVLTTIPEETARRYRIIPIERRGGELTMGMVDPEDVEAREALKFAAVQEKFTPVIYLISASDLEQALRQYRTLGKEVGTALEELESELAQEAAERLKPEEPLGEISAEAPITKVVAIIIRHAVEGGASDIHLEPLEDRTRVRFRIDGILHSSIFLPAKIHPAIVARVKILSNLKIDETRIPQDGRFHTNIGGRKIDFRVSSFPTPNGEKVVLRILDPSAGVSTFEELGLIGRNVGVYTRAIQKPFGLILLTGPTGSGKSTTLYTTLLAVNSEEVNIVTLEDPVEYFIPGISQSQIRPEIDYTFATGLRSILRQDPDIIMVGEIRDKETAGLATHAALTGHIVFSTLHTNDAIGIIPRLVNMGVEPYLIPPTLAAGAAQRLVRRLCQECVKPVEISSSQKKLIDGFLANISEKERQAYGLKPPDKLFVSPGCQACGNKGTKGRIAIYEVFEMTRELEELVLAETLSETKLAEEAHRQGMITMKEDGIMKALKGLVSLEEVLRAVEE